VTGLEWSVHQLAAHVAATAENYAKMARGDHVVEQPLSQRQQVIDAAIAERIGVDVTRLGDAIDTNATALAGHLRETDPESRVPYYGVDAPLWVVAGMCLSELIIHGEDLRRTVRALPIVDDTGAYQAFLAGGALSSFVLSDWGRAQTMTLGYQATRMAPIIVAMDRGAVTVSHDSNQLVDAWLGGTARHLLLTAYGRTGLIGGLRTLRLKGRRPYRSLSASRAFQPI
jgi:hypothetical protein